MLYRHQIRLFKANSLLFALIITLITTIYIQEHGVCLIQQQKLFNLEKRCLQSHKRRERLFEESYNSLFKIQKTNNIQSGFQINTPYGSAKVQYISSGTFLRNSIINNYNTYRIDLLVDDGYASKLHIYVAVCEDGESSTALKIIPISNLLS